MKARDVMVSHPSVVRAEDSVAQAARLMRDHRVGILPVVDDLCRRSLLGVVTDHDLVRRGARDVERTPVGSLMTARDVATIAADADLEDAMRLMRRRGLRRIPAVAEGGRLVGLVTLESALRQLGPGVEPVRAPRRAWRHVTATRP